MFDVGFWELALIGVVALLIVGPERLPGVARTVGLWLGKARRILREAKADLEREMKAHDIEALHDLKRDAQNAGREFKRAASDVGDAAAKPGDALRESIKDAAAKMDGDGGGDGDTVTVDAADTVTATHGDVGDGGDGDGAAADDGASTTGDGDAGDTAADGNKVTKSPASQAKTP